MKQAIVKLCYALMLSTLLFSCKKDAAGLLKESEGKEQINAQTKPDVDIIETEPPVQVAVNATITDNCSGFYRALPAKYNATSKKYPLLIFVHGSGELGNGTTELSKVLVNAVPKLINNKKFPPNFNVGGKNFSFIILNPQFKAYPTATDIYALIQHAIANYRIDATRIYVSGLSMGGGVTWEFAAKYPGLPAAIVPICGGSTAKDAKAKAIASANLPVWAFHNEDDNVVPVNNTKSYISMINNYKPNPKARMTLWPTGKHDAWTKATNPDYRENNMNMYEWMLQYHR